MADIELTCARCGETVTVSEFVDVSSLSCRTCGAPLAGTPVGRERPKLKTVKAPPTDAQAEAEAPAREWRYHEIMSKAPPPRPRARVSRHIVSWTVFVVLGGSMGILRYANILAAGDLSLFITVGPIIVLAFYVFIILRAFRDDIFHGILSVIIPGYPLYYLFLISDDFYLRAVVAGLLAGCGQDTLQVVQGYLSDGISAVNAWIASGGE